MYGNIGKYVNSNRSIGFECIFYMYISLWNIFMFLIYMCVRLYIGIISVGSKLKV